MFAGKGSKPATVENRLIEFKEKMPETEEQKKEKEMKKANAVVSMLGFSIPKENK